MFIKLVTRVLGKILFVVLCMIAGLIYILLASYQEYAPAKNTKIPTLAVAHAESDVIQAKAYAVFDVESGEILNSKSPYLQLPIASITKLPAAAAALDTLDLEATTTLTWGDVSAEGRAGKLEPAQVYTYRELLFPLLLESSNDAALALERLAGVKLLARMNELVTTSGATSTHFVDASGLSSENQASAKDLALLTTLLYQKYPFLFDVSTLPQYIGPYTGWVNNNPLHSEEGYLGGKHGYTEAAGRTIVALFDEPLSGGVRTVGYVVLGSEDLTADIDRLRTFVKESVHVE